MGKLLEVLEVSQQSCRMAVVIVGIDMCEPEHVKGDCMPGLYLETEWLMVYLELERP